MIFCTRYSFYVRGKREWNFVYIEGATHPLFAEEGEQESWHQDGDHALLESCGAVATVVVAIFAEIDRYAAAGGLMDTGTWLGVSGYRGTLTDDYWSGGTSIWNLKKNICKAGPTMANGAALQLWLMHSGPRDAKRAYGTRAVSVFCRRNK